MRVKLSEVSDKATSNYAQKDLEKLSGDYPVYGAGGFIKNIDTFQQGKERKERLQQADRNSAAFLYEGRGGG